MKIFPMKSATRGARRNAPARKKRGGLFRLRAWFRLHGRFLRRGAIAAVTVAVIMALYVGPGAPKGYLLTEGQIAKSNIIAPFDFPVLKNQADLDRERAAEARKVLPVVRYSDEMTETIRGKLRDFFFELESIIDTEGEVAEQHGMISDLDVPFTESARNVLLDLASETKLRQEVTLFFDDVLDAGVLTDKDLFRETGHERVSVIRDGEEYTLGLDQFHDVEELKLLATERGRVVFGENNALLTTFYEVVDHFRAANLFYDVTETASRQEARKKSVSPYTEIFLKDQKIIGAHERVTKRHVQILESMTKKLADEVSDVKPWLKIYPHLGRFLVIVTVIALFSVFLSRHRKKIYASDRKLILISVIAVTGIGLTALINTFDLSPYLFPVVLVAMLATMLFDERVGMGLVGAYLVVIGLVEGLPLPLLFTLAVAGSAACYGISGLRERKSFWYTLGYIAAAYIISISATDFLHLAPSAETIRRCGFGLLSAFTCAGLAMIALPVFESLFRVTTNITLLELSDLNRPLLKNLSLFAPGTYHHSIMVGNLSEAAAEQIGANSLLARVCAYYHDIGKMSKPEYFVENQVGMENKHDKLSPKISALILVSHVREGVEMARKEGLPAEIISAIREHHGTTCMAFFYDKAKKSSPEAEVPEGDFRYPGPKPGTKENGIIMLADVCEACVRALDDPTPARIRQRITQVTNRKFEEGQLDDCDLTFRELRLIQGSFIPILTSSLHSRIRYPDEMRREEAQLAVGDLLRKPPEKL